jgi:hypothetical protein
MTSSPATSSGRRPNAHSLLPVSPRSTASGPPRAGRSTSAAEAVARAGNQNAVKHGGYSAAQTAPVARAQKRWFLRQIGLRASELDGVGLALLDCWARAAAKVKVCDDWYAQNGFLAADGSPQGPHTIYVPLLNLAQRSAVRLADHLRARDPGLPGIEALIVEGRAIRERVNGGDG